MPKKPKKHPFSFSFSEKTIKNLKHYKYTHPDLKLSQEVEKALSVILPDLDTNN